MPGDPPESWPVEAHSVFREYRVVEAELARRNSMRGSGEISRFMKELDSGQPLSDEVLRWWLARY